MVTTACTTVNGTPASAVTSPCTSSPSTSTIHVPATIACAVFTTTTAISIGPSAGTSAPSSTTALCTATSGIPIPSTTGLQTF